MSTPATIFEPPPTYGRFTRSDRVQHAAMALSFLVLAVSIVVLQHFPLAH